MNFTFPRLKIGVNHARHLLHKKRPSILLRNLWSVKRRSQCIHAILLLGAVLKCGETGFLIPCGIILRLGHPSYRVIPNLHISAHLLQPFFAAQKSPTDFNFACFFSCSARTEAPFFMTNIFFFFFFSEPPRVTSKVLDTCGVPGVDEWVSFL